VLGFDGEAQVNNADANNQERRIQHPCHKQAQNIFHTVDDPLAFGKGCWQGFEGIAQQHHIGNRTGGTAAAFHCNAHISLFE
jgi:hypothetical protein